jgi:hypothetical protein
MSIAVAVKHMLAAGMDPDAIVSAVEEMEEANMPSPGALRTRRWREKKASQTSQCDAGDGQERPPTPPKEKTPPLAPIGGIPPRGPHLAPADWQPRQDTIEILRSEGASLKTIEATRRRMVDWSIGSGKRKTNWDATLRNWVRGDLEKQKPRGSPKHPMREALDRLDEDLKHEPSGDKGPIIDASPGEPGGDQNGSGRTLLA